MRKTLQIPIEIDKLLSEYLKKVETQQGFKISKSSWVAQSIREKIEKDGALERRFQKVVVDQTTLNQTIER